MLPTANPPQRSHQQEALLAMRWDSCTSWKHCISYLDVMLRYGWARGYILYHMILSTPFSQRLAYLAIFCRISAKTCLSGWCDTMLPTADPPQKATSTGSIACNAMEGPNIRNLMLLIILRASGMKGCSLIPRSNKRTSWKHCISYIDAMLLCGRAGATYYTTWFCPHHFRRDTPIRLYFAVS